MEVGEMLQEGTELHLLSLAHRLQPALEMTTELELQSTLEGTGLFLEHEAEQGKE